VQAVPAEPHAITTVQGTVNLPPISVALLNSLTSLPENTSTASRTKLGDILIADDGYGENLVAITGADAASFEVEEYTLYLKSGVVLDYESGKTSFSITVEVDDPSVGFSPDLSTTYELAISDVDDTNDGSASFSISGSAIVGNTLGALLASNDPDGNGVGGFTYSWQSSTNGSDWSEIGTASSYAVADDDQGKHLQLVVSYTDGQGFSESVATAAGLVPLLPTLSISGPTLGQLEGNIGSTAHAFTITRSGDLNIASSVAWTVAGNGANPVNGLDFAGAQLPSGLALFAVGQTTFPLSITVVGDGMVEADEVFSVTLSSPTGAHLSPTGSQATSQILNDDLPEATYTLSPSADPVYEGNLLRIGLSTTNVEVGRRLYWQLSGTGITASDVSDGLLSGESLIGADGRTSFTTTLATDGASDPDEQLEVRLFTDASRTQQVGTTLLVTIKEPSVGASTDGNDVITGTTAGEILTGVPEGSSRRGQGTVDRLTGAGGDDSFVLGDARGPYYNDGTSGLGTSDLAVITDFNAGDKIQLYGTSANYSLAASFYGGSSGVRINLRPGTPLPQTGGGSVPLVGQEAIGFIQGATLSTFNLSSSSQFQYITPD
jgi:hypothetical protein